MHTNLIWITQQTEVKDNQPTGINGIMKFLNSSFAQCWWRQSLPWEVDRIDPVVNLFPNKRAFKTVSKSLKKWSEEHQ
jgi:hypothetical protein